MTTFRQRFSRHVGSAFARQLAFADLLGDRNWSLNVPSGIATFGDDMRHSLARSENNSVWR